MTPAGGRFRISLTYQDPAHARPGKSSENTDTFEGKLVELVPYTKILEVVEFESQDPAFRGETRITVSLADVEAGTEITMFFESMPKGIRPEDNERGSKSSLEKLAALLEGAPPKSKMALRRGIES